MSGFASLTPQLLLPKRAALPTLLQTHRFSPGPGLLQKSRPRLQMLASPGRTDQQCARAEVRGGKGAVLSACQARGHLGCEPHQPPGCLEGSPLVN